MKQIKFGDKVFKKRDVLIKTSEKLLRVPIPDFEDLVEQCRVNGYDLVCLKDLPCVLDTKCSNVETHIPDLVFQY